MLLKIYLTGAIAGLLFPVIYSMSLKYSQQFHRVNDEPANKNIRDYVEFPWWMKLIAAAIPVFNLIWIIAIMFIARFFIMNWWYSRVEAFIWWLAGTSIKKHLMFKMKLVRRVFPAYKDYYYKSLEKRHWNYKLAKDIEKILKKIAAVAQEGKDSDQVFADAVDLVPDKKEDNERDNKS